MVFLTRIDVSQNMARWYIIEVQPTLFDELAVVCGWGRIGTAYERWRVLPVDSQDKADEMVETIVRKKVKKGYQFGRHLIPAL